MHTLQFGSVTSLNQFRRQEIAKQTDGCLTIPGVSGLEESRRAKKIELIRPFPIGNMPRTMDKKLGDYTDRHQYMAVDNLGKADLTTLHRILDADTTICLDRGTYSGYGRTNEPSAEKIRFQADFIANGRPYAILRVSQKTTQNSQNNRMGIYAILGQQEIEQLKALYEKGGIKPIEGLHYRA